MEDDLDDSSRYDSAAGWEEPDPYKKDREKARLNDPLNWQNPFRAERGCQTKSASVRSRLLFGELWREGEVALLLGEAGVGKSLLAVQIAETLARGRRSRPFFPISMDTPAAKRVLFFDLEQTDARFVERYSVPRTGRVNGVRRYSFSSKFDRRTLDPEYEMPSVFKGDLDKYLRWAMAGVIAGTNPDVIIIDGLAYFASGASADRYAIRVMRMLKTWAAAEGISVLVTAHAKVQARRRPLSLSDIAVSRRLGDLADSVFILGRSTLGDDIRYLKHLKSVSSKIMFGENNVAVYRLERSEGPVAKFPRDGKKGRIPEHLKPGSQNAFDRQTPMSMPLSLSSTPEQNPTDVSPGSTALSPSGLVSATSFPSSRDSAALPFLGLTHLGFSRESENHRDYEKEFEELFQRENKAEKRRLTRAKQHPTSARNTADMLLSREYQRYLEP